MTDSASLDRSRRAEDDYFRRKDAELLAKARAALGAQRVDQDFEYERRLLSDAIGLHHLDVVVPLHTAGLRADSVVLLEWLPAVEVAWVDDIEVREREELRRQFAEGPDSGPSAMALLTEWLFVRPPHEAIVAAKRALRHRLEALDPTSRRDMLGRIVARCEAVGRASGGLLGLGALSWNEGARIDGIREDLGDEPEPLPVDIPH